MICTNLFTFGASTVNKSDFHFVNKCSFKISSGGVNYMTVHNAEP